MADSRGHIVVLYIVMYTSYQGQSYKSAVCLRRWSSCVRLSLAVWTVDVVAACKAFQVARKLCEEESSTIAATVVLYSLVTVQP